MIDNDNNEKNEKKKDKKVQVDQIKPTEKETDILKLSAILKYVSTLLNLTKRDNDVRFDMIQYLEQNNEFVFDEDSNIKLIWEVLFCNCKLSSKNYDILLTVFKKFLLSSLSNGKELLLKLILESKYDLNMFSIVFDQYIKSYKEIDYNFMSAFIKESPIILSSSNSVKYTRPSSIKETVYMEHINKLIPNYIKPDITILELSAKYKNIMMMHFLEQQGIYPTVTYLSYICSALNIKEIQRLITMKIFPNKDCMINAINSCKDTTEIEEIEKIISLLYSTGVKIDTDIITHSVTNNIKLNLNELNVVYNIDMFLIDLMNESNLYFEHYANLNQDQKTYYELYSNSETQLNMILDMEEKFGFKPTIDHFHLAMKFSHNENDIINHVINQAQIDITFDILRSHIKCKKQEHLNFIIDKLEEKCALK